MSYTEDKKVLQEQTMVNIGLSLEARNQVVNSLNVLLANEYVLYTKTQNFHWNVTGKHFGPLHELFQQQYEQIANIIDKVAERIRALGSPSIGSLQEFLQNKTIEEAHGALIADTNMLQQLLTDHEHIIKQLRTDTELTARLNDTGTNNFLSNLIEQHEKIAWILRAHLVTEDTNQES